MLLHVIGKPGARWKDATTRSTTEDRIVAVTPNIMIVKILLGIETFPAAIALVVPVVFTIVHQLVAREMCPPPETLATLVADVKMLCSSVRLAVSAVMMSDMIIETAKCAVDLMAVRLHTDKRTAGLVVLVRLSQVLGQQVGSRIGFVAIVDATSVGLLAAMLLHVCLVQGHFVESAAADGAIHLLAHAAWTLWYAWPRTCCSLFLIKDFFGSFVFHYVNFFLWKERMHE